MGMSPGGGLQGQQNPIIKLLLALKQHLASRGQGQDAQAPGGATPPFQPSTTQGGQGPRGTLPMSQSGGGQAPSSRGGSSPAGQMVSAVDPHGTEAYQGFQGLAGLLQQWTSRKSQNEHVKAANIAMKLRKAMDDNDVAMVHEILNDKDATKVLNKVYKGWLTKSQEAQKPGKEPDPAVSGFEKGVTDYEKGKTQQKPQAPHGGSPQQTQGGYMLPQAGPAQQAATNVAKTAAITSGQDLQKAEAGELTEAQQAEHEKYAAEMEKYKAEIMKAGTDLQKSQAEARKAEFEYKTAQQKAITEGKRDEATIERVKLANQKAGIDLDIQKQRLANTIQQGQNIRSRGQQLGKINQSYKLKWQMIGKAENLLKLLATDKQKIDGSNVTDLAQLLSSAGANSIAKNLLEQQKTWYKSYSSPEEVLKSLNDYKESFQATFKLDKEGVPSETTEVKAGGADAPPDEGVEDDSDIVVSPEEVAGKP